MKKLIYILLAGTFLLGTSCKKDKKIKEVKTVEVDGVSCNFDFNTMTASQEISVGCNHDLGGATIILPVGVKIKYNGGSIVNGVFVFSNGKIAGELLNINLGLQGTGQLIDTNGFEFVAEKWDVTRGVISDLIALDNQQNIMSAIDTVKFMHGAVFNVHNLDAYFNVSYTASRHDENATIMIPSNFHFKMGNNVNLRVQPNGKDGYMLLGSRATENITISGGHLWGDRYAHDYTLSSTHEWGHVIMLRGVHNGVVDGVELREGSGDGIEIGGLNHRNTDGTLKVNGRECNNIFIKNCKIDDNRRNNFSIVDGTDLYIEYNTISNAGSGPKNLSGVYNSNGTSPRAGIDIEPYKNNAPDNNSVYDYEKCEEIHIRYNTFTDNYYGDLTFFNGQNAYAYGNSFSSSVGTSYGYNNKIYNNTFTNFKAFAGSKAINIEPEYWANGNHRITDFEVYGNTIIGYQFAIVSGGKDHKIHDNTITDCQRGITILRSLGSEYKHNNITSTVSGSWGYRSFFGTGVSYQNVSIVGGTINVDGTGIHFHDVNTGSSGSFLIDSVYVNNPITLHLANDFTVQNSSFKSLNLNSCTVIQSNNTIIP